MATSVDRPAASQRGAPGAAGGTVHGVRAPVGGLTATALWRRQLTTYPSRRARSGYLAVVVVTTIVLYYLYYVEGAVTPLLLPSYHMSFLYFLYLLVVSNAIGACSAVIGGLSDRIGRANLTIAGTLMVGVVQLTAIPHIHSRLGFAVAYCVIGFVEGVILVSTPALIRDFSPQMGRASAMGFWALGPTVGSLVASLVATHTLTHLHAWQDQFVISGAVCMVVAAVSLATLRELSPQLRDQLMVSEDERALVEARARGIDPEAATRHPWRAALRLDLLASSFGISLFLLVYYASVSVLTLYWVVVFNRTTAEANGINTWYWSVDAVVLVVVGLLSDRLRVRKPFMVLGAAGTFAMTVVMLLQIDHPATAYADNVIVVVLLGLFIGVAYTPWMAAYTETVEAHNPALVASGLAVWGWVLRIVVAVSFVALPMVITTSTTLVDHQVAATDLQTLEAARPYVPAAGNTHPPAAPASVLDALGTMQPAAPGRALADLLRAYGKGHDIMAAMAAVPLPLKPQIEGLLAFSPLALAVQQGHGVTAAEIRTVASSSPQLAALLRVEPVIVPAQKASGNEWKRWWWVCAAGQLVFLFLVFAVRGRWSPRAAKADFARHEAVVAGELLALRAEAAPAPAAAAVWHDPGLARPA